MNPIEIPDEELQFDYVRSSGPGGQNVNKLSTKAVLRWNVRTTVALTEPHRARLLKLVQARLTSDGELLVTSQKHRTQIGNRRECLARLHELLEQTAHTPRTRRPTKPTKGSKIRRRKAKESRSQKKDRRRPPSHDA